MARILRRYAIMAATLAGVAGCFAAAPVVSKGDHAVFRTFPRTEPAEVYGYNPNPPEPVAAIPIGQDVTVPAGKAAMTLYITLPRREELAPADRTAQWIDFNRISQVEITIVGESLANPLKTTVSIGSGSSAAATVILAPGRNQIITAVGKDSQGNAVATVKGVGTSTAGQVSDVSVKFGTTPLATVIAGLDSTTAPAVSASAIAGVIDPVLNAKVVNNRVSYGTHPLFIDTGAIVTAIKALVAGGKAAGAITSADITGELTKASKNPPVVQAATVIARVVDPAGSEVPLPAASPFYNSPYDANNDGIPDGADAPRLYYSAGYIDDIFTDDPVSGYDSYGNTILGYISGYNSPPNNARVTVATKVPPGSYKLFYDPRAVSTKAWIVMSRKPIDLTVAPGETRLVNLKLVDVTKNAPVGDSGGSYVAANHHEWSAFATKGNVVYTIKYGPKPAPDASDSAVPMPSEGGLQIFDQNGTKIHSGSTGGGSYTFASSAANQLRLYVGVKDTQIDVKTEALAASGKSAVKAGIDYGQ